MSIKILRSKNVVINRGYAGEARIQVTEIAFQPPKTNLTVRAWVRENRRASSEEHFTMSSNTRLGHKADGNRVGIEVLELAAPPRWWNAIAAEVAVLDYLNRPVRSHARWTMKTAPECFSQERCA